jgi:dTDP-4-amino-4,6-dideoxygalactose transaminase
MSAVADTAPAALDPTRVSAAEAPRPLWRRRAGFAGGTGRWSDAVALLLASRRARGAAAVEALHAALRGYLGVPHVFTYGAGRMALYETLRALEVGPGDEIVVPGFTCAVVVNAILFAGATPVYADIELETLGPDPREVASRLGPRTRAVIVQHLFGVPCRLEEIIDLARSRRVVVIEDAAMALGARLHGAPLGSIGDAGFYSCERTKMISTGNGGILATADDALGEKLRRRYCEVSEPPPRFGELSARRWVLDHLNGSPLLGRLSEKVLGQLRRARLGRGRSWNFECEMVDRPLYREEYAGRRWAGYPCRLDGGLALLALRQLRRLEAQIAHRTALAGELRAILVRKGASVPRPGPGAQPSWLRFPFWVENPQEWAARLRRAGIECHRFCRWFDGPVHPAECAADPWFRYERGTCPRGEWLGRHILNLPLHPRLGRWLLRRVARL